MFFILSKTIDFLVMPFTLICMAMIAAAVVRNVKWKKRLLWTAVGLLLFFSNDFISNEAIRAWEMNTVAYNRLQPHEMGIVLTGATIPNRYPADRVYFARGADRVTHTVQMYKMGLIKRILISGGTGRLVTEEEPEANKFRNAMVMMGVPGSDILIENETRNTYESAVRVKPMLDSLNLSAADCLLITSAFHMRRSLACYRKAGLDIMPFTTDFYSHPRSFYPDALFIPRLDAVMIWHKLTKEWVGMLAYKVAGYI
jgi:uncharacterized SAM-binding protein YcdF (DUF218 family)